MARIYELVKEAVKSCEHDELCVGDSVPGKFWFFRIMHLDINNTFLIDFDLFRKSLSFIFVANAYIIGYLHHSQQFWGPVGMQFFFFWGGGNDIVVVRILYQAVKRLYVAVIQLYVAIRRLYVAIRRLYGAVSGLYVAAKKTIRGS